MQTPRKRILAIVDPDTNEEVKINNVDAKPAQKTAATVKTPPASVKIPERTSRPLELVSDPAENVAALKDSSKSVPDDETVEVRKAPTDSEISESKQVPPVNTVHSEIVENSIAPLADTQESSSSNALSSYGAKPIETVTGAEPVTAKENVGAGGSSINAEGDSSTSHSIESVPPIPVVPVMDKPDDVRLAEGPSDDGRKVDQPNAAPVVSSGLSEAPSNAHTYTSTVVNPETRTIDGTVEPPKLDTARDVDGAAQAETGSVMSTMESTVIRASEVSETDESSIHDDKNISPPTMKSGGDEASYTASTTGQDAHNFGGRRVYAPNFMLSMRAAANRNKAAKYELALSSNNLFKGTRTEDPRGTRTMRPVGDIFTGPRGKQPAVPQTGPAYMTPPVRGPRSSGLMGSGGVGSHDDLDFGSVRGQNPPPPPKGPQGTMNPRGPRQGNARDRFDGPIRRGPIDPFLNLPPVEKLKRSEKGWKRNRESDDEIQTKVKQVRSLLNKLTLEKFDKIFKQIIDINISSYEVLKGVVKEVFEKALFEPKFSGMYAELCGRLDVATRDMLQRADIIDSNGKPIFFRNILLNNCKDEFTRFAIESEGASKAAKSAEGDASEKDEGVATEEGTKKKSLTPDEQKAKIQRDKEEADLLATKAKRRMLANVRFISELYLKGLLRETIIHKQCIQRLLTIGIEKKEEDVLEALCKLLSKTGAKLSENKDAIQHINRYFQPLEKMSQDHSLPARVRFMLQDLIEQRANNWKLRREEAGAKTIAEIHQDIEKEERAKQEAQAASRERRGRGGGGMQHRERNQQNYPRVPMTMAARQKPAGNGISRSAAVIEKHGNRGPSNPPASFQTVRLGPGGSKLSSMTAGSAVTGRVGSRYGALAMMNETRENNVVNQSNDPRRAGPKKMSPGSRRPSLVKREQAEERIVLLEPEKLFRMTSNLLGEYWAGIAGITQARQFLETEILPPNYPRFIEEAIKCSVDAKMDQREKSVSFFCSIIDGPIPAKLFVLAFSSVIAQLPDLELDNPRALEILAKYIGATAATKRFAGDNSSSFGLQFVKTAIGAIDDHKRGTKVVVHVLSELYKNLTASIPEADRRQAAVKYTLDELDIDLPAKMSLWNPMNGAASLDGMLRDQGIPFVLPILDTELQLKKVLSSSPSADEVSRVFMSSGLIAQDVHRESFMRMVIRVSFDWLFMDPPPSIKEQFSAVIRNPLVQCLKPGIAHSVQMAALLATQWFITNNLHCLPPHKEGDTDKPGHIAFESLYEADIVEEEVFLKWKEDTGKTTAIEGKDKMLMQTTHFFNWLETAEEEE